MLLTRAHRRFTTWLAMLALVLGALAPVLAQAVVASSDRAQWVEVCSASGMVWVKADAAEDAARSQDDGHRTPPVLDAAMSCDWCSLHGASAALPPPTRAVETQPLAALHPLAFFQAASLTGVWAVAHARAPPRTA